MKDVAVATAARADSVNIVGVYREPRPRGVALDIKLLVVERLAPYCPGHSSYLDRDTTSRGCESLRVQTTYVCTDSTRLLSGAVIYDTLAPMRFAIFIAPARYTISLSDDKSLEMNRFGAISRYSFRLSISLMRAEDPRYFALYLRRYGAPRTVAEHVYIQK